ncbi:alkaline phosphatase family protein [Saccharopolyspora flava]|uniref:Type I phosphodiesterase / nucleotide pyrophosphatase n=1 Tax=Saccharopolyspora flava TaxID=95161 RepID=A0A1I6PH46_9PSEU|nr:nucleotide pyrophosphatase/phosphodiesterase family protein [Saccharopolyspora flava]SFS39506.1 Type I phosphodiesterase / nucleotide pyrophosphatase [Saccharopolyspora flava]
MDWIVAPDPNGRALRDVLPSMLSALDVEGFTDTIGIPPCRTALVLLIDGLGHELLREHAADAPFLSSLQSAPPLTAGFPTTTVTSITSLATGRCAGEHGLVGYTFAEPGGGLLHPLSWTVRSAPGGAGDERGDMIEKWPPEQVQPHATVLERAAAAGVDVRTAVPGHFEGTGLTRASMRGAAFRGVRELGDLAAELLAAAQSRGPALCYGYHGGVDLLGHIHGPGSIQWRMQLRQIDAFVQMIAEALPPGAVLGVVADHGMVDLDPAEAIDADADPALSDGVRLIGGEVRVRQVYARPGARDDVLAAWRDTIGAAGAVMTGEQAIDEGYFGPVSAQMRPRIGDVLAIMRSGGVIRSVHEPGESALRGHHGSLTAAEQLVPVLVTGG